MRLQPQIEVSSNCHCHRPADRSPAGSISGPIYWLVPGRSVVPEALARALSSDGSAPPSDRPKDRPTAVAAHRRPASKSINSRSWVWQVRSCEVMLGHASVTALGLGNKYFVQPNDADALHTHAKLLRAPRTAPQQRPRLDRSASPPPAKSTHLLFNTDSIGSTALGYPLLVL